MRGPLESDGGIPLVPAQHLAELVREPVLIRAFEPGPFEMDWLALCLCTESSRPEEWPYIARVILNRVAAPGRFPDTIQGVVTQRMQFSAFNDFSSMRVPADMFRAVFAAHVHDVCFLLQARTLCGRMSSPPAEGIISPVTFHYYSPVSMKPRGSAPRWAPSASRLYTPEGINPDRFVFAEGVP